MRSQSGRGSEYRRAKTLDTKNSLLDTSISTDGLASQSEHPATPPSPRGGGSMYITCPFCQERATTYFDKGEHQVKAYKIKSEGLGHFLICLITDKRGLWFPATGEVELWDG